LAIFPLDNKADFCIGAVVTCEHCFGAEYQKNEKKLENYVVTTIDKTASRRIIRSLKEENSAVSVRWWRHAQIVSIEEEI